MKPFTLPDGVLETVNDVVVSKVDFRTVMVSGISTECNDISFLVATYDLAHKCKIWAFKRGYDIFSSVDHEFDSDNESKFIGYAYPCNTRSDEEFVDSLLEIKVVK